MARGVVEVIGNFDICLKVVRDVAERDPVRIRLVNSVNPDRIAGQKTAAFEICDQLGDAPTHHFLPVGNAGNITAYWAGYQEYKSDGLSQRSAEDDGLPGGRVGADRARPSDRRSAYGRDRDQNRQSGELEGRRGRARRVRRHHRHRHRRGNSRRVSVDRGAGRFRRAGVGGVGGGRCSSSRATGGLKPGSVVVCTLTGHGLKDPDTALKNLSNTIVVEPDIGKVLKILQGGDDGTRKARSLTSVKSRMKYIIIHGDGMADWPCDELGGKTPLEAAQQAQHGPARDARRTRTGRDDSGGDAARAATSAR